MFFSRRVRALEARVKALEAYNRRIEDAAKAASERMSRTMMGSGRTMVPPANPRERRY